MRALGAIALPAGQRPVFDYPRPEPFDPVETALHAALVTVVIVVGGWLLLRYLRLTLRRLDARTGWRQARAETYLRLEELGAAVAESPDPATAERYATARTLFDQAHTLEAMAAVRRIAEEGLAGSEDGR